MTLHLPFATARFTFKWQSFKTNDLPYHEYEIQMRQNVYDV